jgi:hypothetical protein
MEESTDLFGISVPSTDKVFLTFVVIHILISLIAVVSGLLAMFADKTKKAHPNRGRIYFWSMAFAYATIVILSVMRWPHNIHLLVIGSFAFILMYIGQRLTKSKQKHWTRLHTVCMGMSYVFLLTGFYVDNGKNLPFWNLLPQWAFYILPSLVGVPVIVKVYFTHPLNKS